MKRNILIREAEVVATARVDLTLGAAEALELAAALIDGVLAVADQNRQQRVSVPAAFKAQDKELGRRNVQHFTHFGGVINFDIQEDTKGKS